MKKTRSKKSRDTVPLKKDDVNASKTANLPILCICITVVRATGNGANVFFSAKTQNVGGTVYYLFFVF